MNEAELRMVLDALRSLSGDASTAAIWWMALHYGTHMAGWLIGAGATAWTVTTVVRYLMSLSEWMGAARSVSCAWGGRGNEMLFQEDRDAINRAMRAAPAKEGR